MITISPLMTISSALMEAIASQSPYRDMTAGILENTQQFDTILGNAIVARPAEDNMDYVFDPDRFDGPPARDVFLRIRAQRQQIESEFPLLEHAAGLLDYLSHITTNVIAPSQRRPRPIARVFSDDMQLLYFNMPSRTYEFALAVYMGISPSPVFGFDIPYPQPDVGAQLAGYGFGVFTYLHLASQPDLVEEGRLPLEIVHDETLRSVAAAPIHRQPDGSLVLNAEGA